MRIILLAVILLSGCSYLFNKLSVTNLSKIEMSVSLNNEESTLLKASETKELPIPYADVVYLWVKLKNIECKFIVSDEESEYNYKLFQKENGQIFAKTGKSGKRTDPEYCNGF